jgi:hypothetical protein
MSLVIEGCPEIPIFLERPAANGAEESLPEEITAVGISSLSSAFFDPTDRLVFACQVVIFRTYGEAVRLYQ